MITLTDALRGEHGVFAALFNQIEAAANGGLRASSVRLMFDLIRPALDIHNQIEEEMMMPVLTNVPVVSQSLRMMQLEHRQLDDLLLRIWSCDELHVNEVALLFIEKQRAHLHKEEEFLYTLVDEYMPLEDLQSLGREWVRRRGLGSAA